MSWRRSRDAPPAPQKKLGSYNSYKNQQVAEYGESEKGKAIMAQKEAQKAAQIAAEQKHFFVVGSLPGETVKVKKVQMERSNG